MWWQLSKLWPLKKAVKYMSANATSVYLVACQYLFGLLIRLMPILYTNLTFKQISSNKYKECLLDITAIATSCLCFRLKEVLYNEESCTIHVLLACSPHLLSWETLNVMSKNMRHTTKLFITDRPKNSNRAGCGYTVYVATLLVMHYRASWSNCSNLCIMSVWS